MGETRWAVTPTQAVQKSLHLISTARYTLCYSPCGPTLYEVPTPDAQSISEDMNLTATPQVE